MERSVIVLAGGFSKRFGEDKGLLKLAGKSLILYIIEELSTLFGEILFVVSSKSQEKTYTRVLQSRAEVIIDKNRMQSPLVGASTGFERAQGKYSLLLPCDTPFISYKIMSLLLELCINNDAAIPRWPNSFIEPLQAAYCTKSALAAANRALEDRQRDMHSMIAHLRKVRYVPTSLLRQVDPKLITFFNVNTPKDLRKAEGILLYASATNQKPCPRTMTQET